MKTADFKYLFLHSVCENIKHHVATRNPTVGSEQEWNRQIRSEYNFEKIWPQGPLKGVPHLLPPEVPGPYFKEHCSRQGFYEPEWEKSDIFIFTNPWLEFSPPFNYA